MSKDLSIARLFREWDRLQSATAKATKAFIHMGRVLRPKRKPRYLRCGGVR
jgi:hypothetical protein